MAWSSVWAEAVKPHLSWAPRSTWIRESRANACVLEAFSTHSYAFTEQHMDLLGRLAGLAEAAWARGSGAEAPLSQDPLTPGLLTPDLLTPTALTPDPPAPSRLTKDSPA